MHQLHDQHPLTPQVAVVKSSDPASGTAVNRGDSITYTLTATVSAANLDADLVLEDTLDADLTFGSVTAAGSFTANTAGNPLVFTLPAGTAPGMYSVEYTATVAATAEGSVGNNVLITGPGGDPDPECSDCSTEHPLPDPIVSVNKASDPVSGTDVEPGQFIEYTLTVEIENRALTEPLVLEDTLDDGLLFIGILNQGAFQVDSTANPLVFSLPAGTEPGSYLISYDTRVGLSAVDNVGNNVIITGGGGDPTPDCQVCSTQHPIADLAISLEKLVELGIDDNGNLMGDVGDVLFYEFVITNTGNVPLFDIALADDLVDDLECVPMTTGGNEVRVALGDLLFADGFEGIPNQQQPLNPGESMFCTASYTLTQTDINRGSVTNFATVSAVDDDGNTVESTSTAVYDDLVNP